MAAGVGGIAVGVHTTQFAIRERGLYGETKEFVRIVLALYGSV